MQTTETYRINGLLTQAVTPRLPASAMKTYRIIRPRSTHFRKATCAEINCGAWRAGWKTILAADSDLVQLVRSMAKRMKFTETKNEDGLIEFTFEAGQSCFKESTHTIRTDRPEIYVVRDGDFRGNPRGTEPRIHKNAADWVDDFANHQDKITSQIERG